MDTALVVLTHVLVGIAVVVLASAALTVRRRERTRALAGAR